ncbi:peptide deformylase, putative [Plasmodium gallinaceum]|uniref:Peptide deformylase n=1 Tax=Plasmodium gallinaceum TaxID=5849 RepID=A0A1J1GVP4_PLAGA|nr:peptide deformylase, putative [Plasmodium gallinaceum]CRG96626.1 peptide deformylase, putative [Plasmodium gallinaceum]
MDVLKYCLVLLLLEHYFKTSLGHIISKKLKFYIKNYKSNNIRKNRNVIIHLTRESNKEIKIVKYPNPVLRKKCEDVINFDDNLKNLIRIMFNIMYENKGIGLSAPQVNISKKIIVWNALYEKRKSENERVFINPSIVEQSLIKTKLVEGCLSFPNVEGKIERPNIVSVSYFDLEGNKHLKILKGIHSRIFQHEYDHLNGILFIDRMTQNEKKKIKAKLNQLTQEYKKNYSEEPAI